MKRLNLYLLLIFLVTTPALFQSCDDDDGIKWVMRMATVRSIGSDAFYLETDNGKKLGVGNLDIGWYKPIDGQRVVVTYIPVSNQYEEYDQVVKVEHISNVLTKQIEQLTGENEEEYGDDGATIYDMWIGGNYLNIEFGYYLPQHYRHRVSLVENTTVENPDDGYMYLEYRYNNQDDEINRFVISLVSFNLGEYAPSVASGEYKGIKIRINSIKNGEVIKTFNYSQTKNDKDIENAGEIDVSEGKVE